MQDVIYDGFSFVSSGCVLTNIDHLILADRENQLESIANRNGKVLVQSRFGSKPITLEGFYIGSTIADAQIMYDTIAEIINRQERTLTVPHAGGTRSYVATPGNVIVKQPDGLNRITFSIEFVVPSGKSTDTQITSLVSSTVTTATSNINLEVMGSAAARPLITLTYTAITGGTGQTVSIRNARDFIGLSNTRNWVTGDVVVIDSDNFQLYINNVLTDPVGRLPTWAAGTGALYYNDTFTTRSVNITATYTQHNL